jgi:integrase
MKAKREHQVPLSDRAVEILQSLKPPNAKDDDYIFPGIRGRLPLSNMAMPMEHSQGRNRTRFPL